MNMTDETMTDERTTLLRYLDAQRDSVLAILDGLDDAALQTPVTASAWTPLGMLVHLCGVERYWLQWVLTGATAGPAPWPEGPGESPGPFGTALPATQVIDFYRAQVVRSNADLALFDPADAPRGTVDPAMAELAADVRSIVLHVIEEVARHAGHLDLAREQLDGRTGLGPR